LKILTGVQIQGRRHACSGINHPRTIFQTYPSTIFWSYPSTIFWSYGAGGAGRNTLSILRIKLKLHFVQNVEPDIPPMAGGKMGRFAKV